MDKFEFDEKKSRSNKEKHRIDFVSVQQLWNDQDLIEIQAKSEDEPRFLVIGRIGVKHWSSVITYRSGNIRIISARKSRESEVKLYES